MDLDTAEKTHKLHKFMLTWRGDREIKQFCEKKLLQFFDGNTITWERSGNQVPSSLHLKLRMEFVPFKFDTVGSSLSFDLEKTALLHFFFVGPSTVDEYRSNCRNDIIEWCKELNLVDDVQWMIVFDSAKARERRNRGAVMEKIKSDFSKFMNRVIEIDKSAADSMDSLYLTSKVYMLSFLDKVIIAQEKRLSDRKEDYYRFDFDYASYSNAQMRLIELYYSLNVLERVLAKLDELDGLLSLIVGYFIEQVDRPKWITNKATAVSDCCPLLSVMNCQKQLKYNFLIDARTFIAAQKISALLLLCKERLGPEKNPSCLTQIKGDFAAIVLRHAYHCITTTFENIAALLLSVDNNRLHCWIVCFCLETLQIVRLVVGDALPRSLSHFVCSICILKYKAIKSLIISKEQLSDMLFWLDSALQTIKEDQSDEVLRFRNCFKMDDTLRKFVQECFETSSALLEQYGWIRQRNMLNCEHASLLLKLDRPKLAAPYLTKVALLLIKNGSPLLTDLLSKMVRTIEDNSEVCTDELLNFYVILALCGRTIEERTRYCESLMNKLQMLVQRNKKPIYYPKTWKHYMPLRISYPGSTIQPIKLCALGESLSILLSITSEFPISLPNCKICCIYKKIQNIEVFEKMEAKSHYKCTYSAVEQIARFGCVIHRNNESNTEEESYKDVDSILFAPNSDSLCNLSTGITMLELVAKNNALHCGVYIIDHVEITVLNALVLSFAWSDFQMNDCIQRPTYFIYKQMPTIYLKTPIDNLYAGVWQKLEFELNFGFDPDNTTESVLELHTLRHEDTVKFWCPSVSNWSSKGIFHVKRSSDGSPTSVFLYVYCSMDRLMKYCSEEDATLFAKQLFVTWQGFQWNFHVTFTPLIKAKTAVSLLEEKLLIELQFLRDDDSTWVMIPESPTLMSSTDDAEIPAKLLNYRLTEILPCSSYRIAWLLNGENTFKNAVEEFRFEFKYRIRPTKKTADDALEELCSQIYKYEDVLTIPNRKASYELFAQILPAQPGAVLCRVNIPCDLIVSLRSLSNRAETVIISIDVDGAYWSANEKHKFLYVKESGLGQTSFVIVPNITGFLPYPPVTVHRCQHKRSNSDKSTQSRCDETDFGAVVPSFVRSGGKQVHVLGLQHSSTGDQKYGSERAKRLKEAKNRLAKLFD